MKSVFATVLIFAFGVSYADEIATCRAPSGHTYYHAKGNIPKDKAGWQSDGISNGVFSLVQVADGNFDVLYIDARKKPISAVQDGAVVRLIRASATNLTVFVFYREAMTEIYSFFSERDGGNKFTVLQNRSGDGAFIEKSSLLVGQCDPIKFELVR
ncbi:hypothetical protein PSQ20_21740 [Curvibacter sp. RS43]|uniref:hypothetical protein n=1 Tax=Curvibacter microcysteis TaxID=3026419 RepID=UPI00235E3FCF|nr:hypothetical protein [Curvibacter sp. RS43]MDD0812973.1 hypothetical protein [Curvibacter sp. RS43]